MSERSTAISTSPQQALFMQLDRVPPRVAPRHRGLDELGTMKWEFGRYTVDVDSRDTAATHPPCTLP